MTVTWTLRDAAGTVVDTQLDARRRCRPARSYAGPSTADAGRRDDAAARPLHLVRDRDRRHVVATQSVAFETDAFRIKPSDTTPGRGQTITVT